LLHKYHVIYSVRYYLQFHVTAVGLGTYYPQIGGHRHYCTYELVSGRKQFKPVPWKHFITSPQEGEEHSCKYRGKDMNPKPLNNRTVRFSGYKLHAINMLS
jgi:hypothetical protein